MKVSNIVNIQKGNKKFLQKYFVTILLLLHDKSSMNVGRTEIYQFFSA